MKKVFKGWLAKDDVTEIKWQSMPDMPGRYLSLPMIEGGRRDNFYWGSFGPPRRIVVTVEVEDKA